jgi:phosphate transport system permease protein
VLPVAIPSILTGVILSLSRVVGETAPLLVIGAVVFISRLPDSPASPFTVLPVQIYNWTTRPQHAFQENAAAGIIVLLALLLTMNGVAIYLRNRYQKRLPI